MRKILKVGIVLLVTVIIIFSTFTVTADTIQDQSKELLKSKPKPLIKQNKPMSLRATDILSEGFESGLVPPPGWELYSLNPTYTWEIAAFKPHSGAYHAVCYRDPYLEWQDEVLVTPSLDFTGYTEIKLSFWWYMSYYWAVEPYNNYDLYALISIDGGYLWTLIWHEDTIGPFTTWEYYDTTFGTHIDLSAYINEPDVKIAFVYYGQDGAEMGLDDILIYGEISYPPTAPTIDGPPDGNPGVEYGFTFHSYDENGDMVRYHIDWGDGSTDITDWYPACTPVTVYHTYSAKGTYTITAFAEDESGLISPSSTFTIIIPRNKAIQTSPILNFLQSHPNLFPLLQKLIEQLGL